MQRVDCPSFFQSFLKRNLTQNDQDLHLTVFGPSSIYPYEQRVPGSGTLMATRSRVINIPLHPYAKHHLFFLKVWNVNFITQLRIWYTAIIYVELMVIFYFPHFYIYYFGKVVSSHFICIFICHSLIHSFTYHLLL